MNFVALDFETANADLSSICQVGLVTFRNGEPTETYSVLVNPDDYFDGINISIHGIDAERVRDAPRFDAVYPEICSRVSDSVVVCPVCLIGPHSPAHPRSTASPTSPVIGSTPCASSAALGRNMLTPAMGLATSRETLGSPSIITMLPKTLARPALSLSERCVRQVYRLMIGSYAQHGPSAQLKGSNALATRTVPWSGRLPYTGALSMPRREAANLAAQAGCEVDAGVTKDTTLLIVGDQDVMRLVPGQTKSSKHLKAEALIASGQPIRILRETDFIRLLAA